MLKQLAVVLFISFVGFSSCKKYPEQIITNNTAPPDSTLPESMVDLYVNKVYISVLGRKPTEVENTNGVAMLRADAFSADSRKEFVDQVLSGTEYNSLLYRQALGDYLNSLDTNEISVWIGVFTAYLQEPQYAPFAAELQNEINRLQAMRTIPALLASNAPYCVADMHRIICNNYFYDQLNMGTFNFITSVFENFLYRSPSESEINGATQMVDGLDGILFFNTGKSKNTFLEIFFKNSLPYYQGQVETLYLRYLYRTPTAEETSQLALLYKNNGNFREIQKTILSSDEYAGIK